MENKQPIPSYYYSESEWNRLGCGPLPLERDKTKIKLDIPPEVMVMLRDISKWNG
jgi:hypothetical protein